VKSHEQIEAELKALGWTITYGPARTSEGWKATITKGTSSVRMTGWNKLGVLEDLLRHAQRRAGGKP
jgi:hypothetical protein